MTRNEFRLVGKNVRHAKGRNNMGVPKLLVFTLALVAVCHRDASGQSRPLRLHGYLAWHVTLNDADLKPGTNEYRLYNELRELVITMAVINESPIAITIDPTVFVSHVHASLAGTAEIPVTGRWVLSGADSLSSPPTSNT